MGSFMPYENACVLTEIYDLKLAKSAEMIMGSSHASRSVKLAWYKDDRLICDIVCRTRDYLSEFSTMSRT